jgi:hypothetical protein
MLNLTSSNTLPLSEQFTQWRHKTGLDGPYGASPLNTWCAGHAHKNNSHMSPMYTLPSELILDIASHLDFVDRMCFALSSCRTRSAIHEAGLMPGNYIQSNQEKWAIMDRYKRDEFYASWPRWTLWCITCQSPYARSHFPSPLEPRHQRICTTCIGSSLRLRICAHVDMDFVAVRHLAFLLRAPTKHIPATAPSCGFCVLEECIRGGIRRTHRQIRRIERSDTDKPTFALVSYFTVQPNQRDLAVQRAWDFVGPALQNWKAVVCSHMASDFAPFVDAMSKAKLLTRRQRARRPRTNTLIDGHADVVSTSCAECTTSISMSKNEQFAKTGSVTVEIRRELGTLTSPGDTMWLAQAQVALDARENEPERKAAWIGGVDSQAQATGTGGFRPMGSTELERQARRSWFCGVW